MKSLLFCSTVKTEKKFVEKIVENKIACLVVRCHEQDNVHGNQNILFTYEKRAEDSN